MTRQTISFRGRLVREAGFIILQPCDVPHVNDSVFVRLQCRSSPRERDVNLDPHRRMEAGVCFLMLLASWTVRQQPSCEHTAMGDHLRGAADQSGCTGRGRGGPHLQRQLAGGQQDEAPQVGGRQRRPVRQPRRPRAARHQPLQDGQPERQRLPRALQAPPPHTRRSPSATGLTYSTKLVWAAQPHADQ